MEQSTVQIIKQFIVSLTNTSKNELHIHFGIAIMLLYAIIFHKKLSSYGPWLAVLIIAFIVEGFDFRDDLVYNGFWRWKTSIRDFCNTIFWPSILFILFKFRSSWLSINLKK
jgi:cell shape-determining protein MreD